MLVALAQTLGDISYWRGQWALRADGARVGAMSLACGLLHDDLTSYAEALEVEYDPKAFAHAVVRHCVDAPKNLDRRAAWAHATGRALDREVFGG